ncbi:MAG TPA: o-succinylbenzoate synthase [Patescibacteria group bacterium]
MNKKIKIQEIFNEINNLSPVQHTPIVIKNIKLHIRKMKLNQPFETSFARMDMLPKIFIEITFATKNGKEITGIGESPFLPAPWYDGEHLSGGHAILEEFIVPSLKNNVKPITNANDFIACYKWVVGGNIAKVGAEGAYWDFLGKLLKKPVWKLWNGTQKKVECGTSIGLEKTDSEVIEKIRISLSKKIKRIKIKIKPGRDITLVQSIRKEFPNIPLQVDGNAAYDLQNPKHVEMLRKLDKFNLLMIEQPGPNDDIYFHSRLSTKIKTSICLDESILHLRHAYEAVELWNKNKILDRLIINIKPPRVGGFWEAVKIAKFCEKVGVKVWCGGMIESALGKAANVHLSTLSGFVLPADHVSFPEYFKKDIAKSLEYKNGCLIAPNKSGWGVERIKL